MALEEPDGFSETFDQAFDESRLDVSRRNLKIMTVVVLATFFAGLLIKVDVYAFALGRISPENYLQSIDAPRTGMVSAVRVQDGRTVKLGEPILEYDCTTQQAQALAAEEQLAYTQEQLAVRAKLMDLIAPGYAEPAQSAGSSAEAALRASLFRTEVSGARQNSQQAAARINAMQARLATARSEAELARRKYGRVAELKERSFATNAALEEAQNAKLIAELKVRELQASVSESSIAYDQSRAVIQQLSDQRELEVVSEFASIRSRILELQTEIAEMQTGMKDCQVLAPETGSIFWLSPMAKGTWLRSATPLAKIISANNKMLIEARLRNQDIPFVKVGQKTVIKLDSLPFQRYGTLIGRVTFVANDSVVDELGESFYKIKVEITDVPQDARLRLPEFISGMDVQVYVVTDHRRLISYFFDPIILAIQESFHER